MQDRRVPGAAPRAFAVEAKLLEPKDALTTFDGLYTDEFLR